MQLIDADMAAAFAENCGATFVAKRLRDSTAFPEAVVRCHDCKYRRKNDENELYCIADDGLSDPWDDCFCSYGERKE